MLKATILAFTATAGLAGAAYAMPSASTLNNGGYRIEVRGVCDSYGRCYNTGNHGNDTYLGPGGYNYGFNGSPPPHVYRAPPRRYYYQQPQQRFYREDDD